MKTRAKRLSSDALPAGYTVWRQSTDYLYGWQWRTDDGKAKGEGYCSKTSAIEAALRHAEIEAQS